MSAIKRMLRTSNLEMKVNGQRILLGQVVGGALKICHPIFESKRLDNRAKRLIFDAQIVIQEYIR